MGFDALLLLVLRVFHELACHDHVLCTEEQQCGGRQSVAAGAAGFLVVALDVLRHVVVHDEAHVRFVDAHAEGDRGDDYWNVVAKEAFLDNPPHVCPQAGVVGRCCHASARERLRNFLHAPSGERIDNAGFILVRREESAELILRAALLKDLVADIGAVEARDVPYGLLQPQHLHHVLARLRIGCRRQRDQGHAREMLPECAKLCVLRPKVVTPLRHAMRLIDGDQSDRDPSKPLDEAGIHQALGRHVQQVERIAAQPLQDVLRVARQKTGVVERSAYAVSRQCIDLVFHQRDQWRYHQRHARTMQSRELVAKRLAAACGHEDKRVATREEILDDRLLVWPKIVKTEDGSKGFVNGGHRYSCSKYR